MYITIQADLSSSHGLYQGETCEVVSETNEVYVVVSERGSSATLMKSDEDYTYTIA